MHKSRVYESLLLLFGEVLLLFSIVYFTVLVTFQIIDIIDEFTSLVRMFHQ